MALEATHMRFALDLKDKYQVKDLNKYISGAIYPDSRYITKIDRKLTHPIDYMDWDILSLDDFKKGWFTHLLCDKVSWQVIKVNRPEIFEGETGPGSPVWIRHTALKVLQDMNDAQRFDISACLPCLDYVENPNGEDLAQLKQYNHKFQEVYKFPDELKIGPPISSMPFDISGELIAKVAQQAMDYKEDESIMDLMTNIYDEMLNRAISI